MFRSLIYNIMLLSRLYSAHRRLTTSFLESGRLLHSQAIPRQDVVRNGRRTAYIPGPAGCRSGDKHSIRLRCGIPPLPRP